MLTADGPRLLECNVRFGDPETQATLPRLATPLLPLLAGPRPGRLADAAAAAGIAGTLLPVHPGAAVAVVVAAAGYPEAPRTGDPITGIEAARATGALVFCAGVGRERARRPGDRRRAGAGRGRAGTDRRTTPSTAAYAARRPDRHPGHAGPARHRPDATPVAAGARRMIPRYSLPEMADLWTDQARFESMLRVELAVLDVLARAGHRARRGGRGDRDARPGGRGRASRSWSGPPTTMSSRS